MRELIYLTVFVLAVGFAYLGEVYSGDAITTGCGALEFHSGCKVSR